MSVKSISLAIVATTLLAVTAALPTAANATIVRVETVMGDFDINLYDNATPATVTNFLNYVQNGDFSNSIFHRSVINFIVQSGGYRTDLNAAITNIPANPAVTNEPVYSNVRGTIAMAKLGNDPNSATSQWFINLSNNAASLDIGNGGFTVFGEVTGSGMDVVDAIAALPKFAFASPFGELPLQKYSSADLSNGVAVDNTHLIIVTAITVIDSTPDSAGAAGLNPTPTTASGTGGGTTPPPADGGGGGGTLSLLALLGLILVNRKRFL
jgi:peptidyl-prolyl cis-trans isomerase A (cyclophilin A)